MQCVVVRLPSCPGIINNGCCVGAGRHHEGVAGNRHPRRRPAGAAAEFVSQWQGAVPAAIG